MSMPPERPLNPSVKEAPEASDISDPRLVKLLQHWATLTAGLGPSELPSIARIDPLQLGFILGWLMMMDPIDGGRDYRYRLYGSAIAGTTGRDLTGLKVSDSFPAFAEWAIEVYQNVMRQRRPVLTRHSPRRYVRVDQWERLILPFAEKDGSVGRLLVGAVIVGKKIEGDDVRLPWPLRE
jgi:hypothetical protein